ncbi:hypothetical protein NDU88_005903 [Pleurodeles waltl]|uniref:Uncharacterized protein n=1 Tax=Pleurodeles waltl TaxID=8319 RepID=A0AAV7PKW3_PLEWA|nr:hypothetical protein NDU88_005903 [Pleurodeles waltl]
MLGPPSQGLNGGRVGPWPCCRWGAGALRIWPGVVDRAGERRSPELAHLRLDNYGVGRGLEALNWPAGLAGVLLASFSSFLLEGSGGLRGPPRCLHAEWAGCCVGPVPCPVHWETAASQIGPERLGFKASELYGSVEFLLRLVLGSPEDLLAGCLPELSMD